MKAYVSFHPAHPETYAFRVARCFALLFILTLVTACGSSRKSVDIHSKNQVQEHAERLSYGQSLFALFDSLNVARFLQADSLELEVFDAGISGITIDSLAANRPPQSQAPGRIAARLKVKGIRSNTQLTHTHTANSESQSLDTDSIHRISQEEVDESINEEKVVKPPNTLRNLCILLGLAIICFIIWKVKR